MKEYWINVYNYINLNPDKPGFYMRYKTKEEALDDNRGKPLYRIHVRLK